MKARKSRWTAIALGAAGMIILGLALPSAELCAAEPQSFAEDILPIFKGRCVSCHPTRPQSTSTPSPAIVHTSRWPLVVRAATCWLRLAS